MGGGVAWAAVPWVALAHLGRGEAYRIPGGGKGWGRAGGGCTTAASERSKGGERRRQKAQDWQGEGQCDAPAAPWRPRKGVRGVVWSGRGVAWAAVPQGEGQGGGTASMLCHPPAPAGHFCSPPVVASQALDGTHQALRPRQKQVP